MIRSATSAWRTNVDNGGGAGNDDDHDDITNDNV